MRELAEVEEMLSDNPEILPHASDPNRHRGPHATVSPSSKTEKRRARAEPSNRTGSSGSLRELRA